MKTIASITFVAALLGIVANDSSVGGPMTVLLIVVLAMLAVGIHDAWTNGRGPLGWLASIVLAFLGGAAGIAIANSVMATIRSFFAVEGSLAQSGHPLLYVSLAAIALLAVFGAWSATQIPNLFRRATPIPPAG